MSRGKTSTVLGRIDRSEVAARIRSIRGTRTQQEFGTLIGVTQNAVKNYEKGRIPKRTETLEKIAAADPNRRGVGWLLTGQRDAGLVKEDPEPWLTPKQRTIKAEFDRLLQQDEEIQDLLKMNIEVVKKLLDRRGR